MSEIKFGWVKEVYGESINPSEPLSFDVIEGLGQKFGLVKINHDDNKVLLGFNWEVCPQTSGGGNSKKEPLSGAFRDTNVDSFMFPINGEIDLCDYFVSVVPLFVSEDEAPLISPHNICTFERMMIKKPDKKRTGPPVEGDRIFSIFYTQRIITSKRPRKEEEIKEEINPVRQMRQMRQFNDNLPDFANFANDFTTNRRFLFL